MRLLVTTPPMLGHVHPMVPLARALQARGHDVRWAAGVDAQPWIEGAGLSYVPAGLSSAEGRPRLMAAYPEIAALPPEQRPDHMFPKMFGGVYAPPMLSDLQGAVRDWQPALVLHDAAELAGAVIAESLGVPHVTKSFGTLVPSHRVTAAAEVVAPLWESVGLSARAYAGSYDHLYLDVYPPGLQPPLPAYIPFSLGLRQDGYDGEDTGAVELPPGDAPLVYVTMGTVFNDPGFLRSVVAALAELEVRLLVTVGPSGDPAGLGSWPGHVRVERYVQQSAVLGSCAVVVSHGGSGTALAALSRGVPQLLLPQGADQYLNTAAMVRAGVALGPEESGSGSGSGSAVGAVAESVLRLLADAAFAKAAHDWATVMAAMPSADEVAERLESLV
jgi:UDP:flavonoid glycosyltransferase YjiC (YdhE family)